MSSFKQFQNPVRTWRLWIYTLSGLALGIGFLWFALKQIEIDQVIAIIGDMNTSWLLLALLLYAMNMVIRTLRWRLVLKPIKQLAFQSVGSSLMIGIAFNNLIPARLGELLRTYFVSSRYQIPYSSVLATIVLERALDGLTIVALLSLGILLTIQNKTVVTMAIVAGSIFIIALLILLLLTYCFSIQYIKFLPKKVIDQIAFFQAGLTSLGGFSFLIIVILSLSIWMLESLALYTVLTSVAIYIHWQQVLVVLGIVNLSTLLPSAPGFLGTYQYAYVLSLGFFAIPAANAVVAATIFQIFLFGSVTLLGLVLYYYVNVFKIKPTIVNE